METHTVEKTVMMFLGVAFGTGASFVLTVGVATTIGGVASLLGWM